MGPQHSKSILRMGLRIRKQNATKLSVTERYPSERRIYTIDLFFSKRHECHPNVHCNDLKVSFFRHNPLGRECNLNPSVQYTMDVNVYSIHKSWKEGMTMMQPALTRYQRKVANSNAFWKRTRCKTDRSSWGLLNQNSSSRGLSSVPTYAAGACAASNAKVATTYWSLAPMTRTNCSIQGERIR